MNENLYVSEKAEKNGIMKNHYKQVLANYNTEYSEHVFASDKSIRDESLSRFEWINPKMKKLYDMKRRGLITLKEFTQMRATIDKFIFNK